MKKPAPLTPAVSMILRLPSVQEATQLSRSTIYSLEAKGQFPKRVQLSARAVGWRAADIDAWLNSRLEVA